MIYGSVCSGLGGAAAAWAELGWTEAWCAEIDAQASAVIEHRWPGTINLRDFTTIRNKHLRRLGCEPIDVLVGGTPCQGFSTAGLRGGLGDDRSNLALEFLRLVRRTRPTWVVWENVPGVLSSVSHDAPHPRPPGPPLDLELDGQEVETEDHYVGEEVHAFQCFLAGLQELGYGCSWRVLDAQHAGVPQRRRRVFVVGYSGNRGGVAGSASRADVQRFSLVSAAVLFERHSLCGNSPPSREARADVAGSLDARVNGGGFPGTDGACGGHVVAHPLRAQHNPSHREDSDTYIPSRVARALTSHPGRCDGTVDEYVATNLRARDGARGVDSDCTDTLIAHTLRGEGFDASEDGTGRRTPLVPYRPRDVASTLFASSGGASSGYHPVIPFDTTQITSAANRSNPKAGDPCHPLTGTGHPPSVAFTPETAFALKTQDRRIGQGLGNTMVGVDLRNGAETGDVAMSFQAGGHGFSPNGQPVIRSESAVRRLTPVEAERLQGLPDDYTRVPYRGKPMSDSARYKMIGNSWAKPVVTWLEMRIQLVADILRKM